MNVPVSAVKRQVYHCEMAVSERIPPNGRAAQKERTRAALVEAARGLLSAGAPPTVAEAAAKARVSRATAYRYFPTHESLLIEIGNISPATEPIEALLDTLQGNDAEARLLALLDRFNPIVFAEEVPMRTALRTYLDTWLQNRGRGERTPPVREGRRMRWLDKALEPARRTLSPAEWRRLRAALALTLSIDAMVVMKDVCRIEDDDEALAVLRWAAAALLRAGLAEARAAKRRRAK
jgi:AcrR family transcriptional regulator